jgi:hypothetical protein
MRAVSVGCVKIPQATDSFHRTRRKPRVSGLVSRMFGSVDFRVGGLAAPSFGLALTLAGRLRNIGWPGFWGLFSRTVFPAVGVLPDQTAKRRTACFGGI